MPISKIFSIRNYIMKQIMKPNKQGIMQIPDKGKVDFGEMLIKEQLFKKGIDLKAITSEKQLDNILNTPSVSPKPTPKKSGEVIDVDFDKGRWKDIDPDDFAGGGRAGFIFGGGAIKTALKRLKDVKKMKGSEKMLKKNPLIQHLLSTGDKQQLKGLETQFSEQLLKMLQKDRELFLQIQANKAMKDEGLDFLMKHMQETMAPHIKKYKSIEEIDAAILNMENIIKNRVMKEKVIQVFLKNFLKLKKEKKFVFHTQQIKM